MPSTTPTANLSCSNCTCSNVTVVDAMCAALNCSLNCTFVTSTTVTTAINQPAPSQVHGFVLFLVGVAVVTGYLLMRCIRYACFRRYQNVPMNYGAILIFLGVCLGALLGTKEMQQMPLFRCLPYAGDLTCLLHILSPLLAMYSIFSMPAHMLTLKSFGIISVYTCVNTVPPAIAVAVVYHMLSATLHANYDWDLRSLRDTALMLGAAAVLGKSVANSHRLKIIGRTGDMIFLVETEFLMSTIVSSTALDVYNLCVVDNRSALLLLMNLVCVLVALLIGELCINVLKTWDKDDSRDVLLYLVACYLAYGIAKLLHASGMLAACIVAVYLSLSKPSVKHTSAQQISKVAGVLFFSTAHVVYLLGGLRAGHWLVSHSTMFKELGYVCLIGMMCFAMRVVGVSISWLLCRAIRLHKNQLVLEIVKIFGYINGPYCVALSLAYLGALPKGADAERMHVYVVLIVMCGLAIKASLFPVLVYFMNAKKWQAKQDHFAALLEKLRDIKHDVQDITEGSLVFGGARWDYIEESFHGDQHPPQLYALVKPNWFERQIQACAEFVKQRAHVEQVDNPLRNRICLDILRVQITSYTRQEHDGQLSTWAQRILRAAALDAMDGPNSVLTLHHVKAYHDAGPFWSHVRSCVQWMGTKLRLINGSRYHDHGDANAPVNAPMPKNKLRQFFYRMDHNVTYQLIVYCILLTHMIITCVELKHFVDDGHKTVPGWFKYLNKTCYSLYVLEFLIMLIALGKNVFYTKWNILDCVFAIVSAIDLVLELIVFPLLNTGAEAEEIIMYAQLCLIAVRLTKIIRFVRVLVPICLNACDEKLHRCLSKNFDILKGMNAAEDEALRQLGVIAQCTHQLIDSTCSIQEDKTSRNIPASNNCKRKPDWLAMKAIVYELRSLHMQNRSAIIKEMARLYIEHTDVFTSVLTKQVIGHIAHNLRHKVQHWYDMGNADRDEMAELECLVHETETAELKKIDSVLSPPNLPCILKALSWIHAETRIDVPETPTAAKPMLSIEDYVKKHGLMEYLKEGDIVCHQGYLDSDGIFIVVRGVLRLTVWGDDGQLKFEEYFGPGTSLGEISVLTKGRRTAQIAAASEAQVFIIPRGPAEAMLQQYAKAREELMRMFCIRRAFTDVFAHNPAFQSWTEVRLKKALHNGKVIVLNSNKKQKNSYDRAINDRYLILTRGICTVDCTTNAEVEKPKFVTYTADDGCVTLPDTARKISLPPLAQMPGDDDQMWLFVVPPLEKAIASHLDAEKQHAGVSACAQKCMQKFWSISNETDGSRCPGSQVNVKQATETYVSVSL